MFSMAYEHEVDNTKYVCDRRAESDLREDWKVCVKEGDWHLSYTKGGSYELACKKFAIKLNCKKVEK